MQNNHFTYLEFLKHKVLFEDANVSNHNHHCYEITYFIDGTGQTVLKDKTYDFNPNSFIVTKPHQIHKQVSDYTEVLYIGFFYDDSLGELNAGQYIDDNNDLLSMLTIMEKTIQNKTKNYNSVLFELQKLIIYKILNIQDETATAKIENEDFRNIYLYIKKNFYSEIDFKKLAIEYGYSYSNFRHTFKKIYGISPFNFLIRERIQQSMILLTNTSQSIKTIYILCGFVSYASYVALFKQHTNMTPSQYRISVKSNTENRSFIDSE